MVVFACDSTGGPQLWLYSPDGNCQHNIGPLDAVVSGLDNAVMTLYGKNILACGASSRTNCYLYDVTSGKWSSFANTFFTHISRGVVLKGKIYLPDDTNPEVIDLATKKVSTWATAPSTALGACYISWNNYILKFGADAALKTKNVSRYDPANDAWTILTGAVPFDMAYSGCITLPNNNVLIAGSGAGGTTSKEYAEFNVTSNTWLPIKYGLLDHYNSLPVLLGSRVFVLPTNGPAPVEEYIISNRTIAYGATNIQFKTYHPAAVAVPADWFSNLPGGCKGVY